MKAILDHPKAEESSDEALVSLARADDLRSIEKLFKKYEPTVRTRARHYFIMGGDRDDLMQEGMIGLFKAIRDFDPRKSNFRAFADICITRQIITAVKTATRQKHQFLNTAVSMNKPIDKEERSLIDVLVDKDSSDPLQELEKNDFSNDLRDLIMEILSDLEQEILFHYMAGCSYNEISMQTGRGIKSVDNALQRAKRKIGESLRLFRNNK